MHPHIRHPLVIGGSLIALLMILLACGSTGSIVAKATATLVPTATATLPPTATATLVPTATPVPPTATPAPAPGVCNAADFPTKTNGGPPDGFTYPPLTYFYNIGPGAGNNYYVLCSSGNPTSILTDLKNAFPAGGWTVTSSTATTLFVEKPTTPPSGFCYSVNFTVGSHAGYPGEWDADFHPPALAC